MGIEPYQCDRTARFGALYRAHYARVVGYARRRTCVQEADDVAADTFGIAWRRLDDVPDGDRALPWLFGVARRVLADQRRADRRRRRLVARLGALPPALPSPDDHGVDPCLARELRSALDGLRDRDREILWLAVWHDVSIPAMAAAVGCSTNAAAVRLHRARRRLADVLRRGAHPPVGGS